HVLIMVFQVYQFDLLFVKVNNLIQLKNVHNLDVDNEVKQLYMIDYIFVDNVFLLKNIQENDNHLNHFLLKHKIKMVQHHSKVFYDREIILLKVINFDNIYDLYFHRLQKRKDHLYDRFHWQVDEMFHIFSKEKIYRKGKTTIEI